LCLQVKGCSWTAASLRSKPNDPDSGELEGEGLRRKRATIVWSAAENATWVRYNAEVVDMEGFAALEVLSQAGVAVAMLQ